MELEVLYKPNFTKSGKAMLVDLINWGNRNSLVKPLVADEVWFSKPVKLTQDKECNTAIRIEKAIGFRGFEEPKEIEYNRMDIDQVAKLRYFTGEIESELITAWEKDRNNLTIFKALTCTLINDALNIGLVNEDIGEVVTVKKQSANNEPIEYNVTVHIADESIAYFGELQFVLRDRPIRLDTGIKKTRFTRSFMPFKTHGLS